MRDATCAYNISAVDTIRLDDPESILDFLANPLRAVRDALDDGISFADTVLGGLKFDPHFWAHAVRYRAACNLACGQPLDWRITRPLPNSGIEIARDPIVFRTFKTHENVPPPPGTDRARRAFWTQRPVVVLSLPLQWGKVEVPVNGPNLLLDWNVDEERNLRLALSKPIGTWGYQGTPRLEWRRLVIFGSDDEPRFPGGDEDVEVELDLSEITGDQAG
jgi:hypothetical protein